MPFPYRANLLLCTHILCTNYVISFVFCLVFHLRPQHCDKQRFVSAFMTPWGSDLAQHVRSHICSGPFGSQHCLSLTMSNFKCISCTIFPKVRHKLVKFVSPVTKLIYPNHQLNINLVTNLDILILVC